MSRSIVKKLSLSDEQNTSPFVLAYSTVIKDSLTNELSVLELKTLENLKYLNVKISSYRTLAAYLKNLYPYVNNNSIVKVPTSSGVGTYRMLVLHDVDDLDNVKVVMAPVYNLVTKSYGVLIDHTFYKNNTTLCKRFLSSVSLKFIKETYFVSDVQSMLSFSIRKTGQKETFNISLPTDSEEREVFTHNLVHHLLTR